MLCRECHRCTQPPGKTGSIFSTLLQSSHGLPNAIFWEDFACLYRRNSLILLATPAGFEPATFSLEDKNHAWNRLGLLVAAVDKPLIYRHIYIKHHAVLGSLLQASACWRTSE